MRIFYIALLMGMCTICTMDKEGVNMPERFDNNKIDPFMLYNGFKNSMSYYIYARLEYLECKKEYIDLHHINVNDVFSDNPLVLRKKFLERSLQEIKQDVAALFEVFCNYVKFPDIENIFYMYSVVPIAKKHVEYRELKYSLKKTEINTIKTSTGELKTDIDMRKSTGELQTDIAINASTIDMLKTSTGQLQSEIDAIADKVKIKEAKSGEKATLLALISLLS